MKMIAATAPLVFTMSPTLAETVPPIEIDSILSVIVPTFSSRGS
jgi:hypothetical protein